MAKIYWSFPPETNGKGPSVSSFRTIKVLESLVQRSWQRTEPELHFPPDRGRSSMEILQLGLVEHLDSLSVYLNMDIKNDYEH